MRATRLDARAHARDASWRGRTDGWMIGLFHYANARARRCLVLDRDWVQVDES